MTLPVASRAFVLSAFLFFLTCPADAQSVLGPGRTGPAPDPVTLDITGLFLEKYVGVGDDLFIAGQPTEAALRDLVAWRASHLWGAYLIRDRKVPVAAALSQVRTINLREDAPFGSQHPIEGFLERTLPELPRPK